MKKNPVRFYDIPESLKEIYALGSGSGNSGSVAGDCCSVTNTTSTCGCVGWMASANTTCQTNTFSSASFFKKPPAKRIIK